MSKVEEYLDIEVEVEWTGVNAENPVNPDFATGGDAKSFTVTVTMNGSTDFLTYNLSVLINVGGDLDDAIGDGGVDLRSESSNGGFLLMIGDEQNVIVRENVSDPTDNVTGDRFIFSDFTNGGEWTYNGTVTPDTSGNTEANYFVDVSLNAFNLMDVYDSCAETYIVNVTDADGNEEQEDQTFDWVCEEEQRRDAIT